APAKSGANCFSGHAALAVAGAARRDSSSLRHRMGDRSAAGDSSPALAQVQKSPKLAFLRPRIQASAGYIQRAGRPGDCRLPWSAVAAASLLLRTVAVFIAIGFFW